MTSPRSLLRPALVLDAASCALMGGILTAFAAPLAEFTALPEGLLLGAGLVLLPTAVFIAVAARHAVTPSWMLRTIVWGNAVWVAASLAVLALGAVAPNGLGLALVLGQAGTVAALTAVEARGLAPNATPA